MEHIHRPMAGGYWRNRHLTADGPAQGAATSIHLASAPELEQVSGKYFAGRRAIRSSTRSYDQAVAARLWEASADLVGLPAAPRV